MNVNPPYQHRTVNHSQEFVNANGNTTNHAEAMWNSCKRKFKPMVGTNQNILPFYLDEFMWQLRYSNNAFDNILLHISQWFVI